MMQELLLAAVFLTLVLVSTNSATGAALAAADAAGVPLYKQSGAPIEQRVADLISKMTVEEKVYQMLGDGEAGEGKEEVSRQLRKQSSTVFER